MHASGVSGPVEPESGAADADLPVPGGPLPPGWGSYNHFRELFEQSPVAMSLIDLGTRLLYANPAYLRLFGYDQPGALPLDATRLTHPDDREHTFQQYRRLVAGDLAAVDRRKPYVRADGTTFWGHLQATLLRDASGRAWAILNVCRDITAERDADLQLAASEARFRALVQNAADAIIVLAPDGRLTYASPSAGHIVGLSVDDHLGRDALTLVHPDDYEVVAQSFANTAVTPGTAVPLQFRLPDGEGGYRLVEAVATNLIDDPAVGGVVVNLRDLTDRAEAANALTISENRFRKMLENISDTVTLIDRTGRVIRTTGNVKSILGYDTDFWTDRSGFELAHPDDRHTLTSVLEELISEPGHEVTGEFRIRNAAGGYEHVEATGVNLLHDPDVEAIVITSRNISARKAVEQELAEARDQAVRSLASRTEFVASVSHELRTPIHGILGLAELLATPMQDDERVRLARSITRATESLKMVLDDLLDYTKVEAGRLELAEEAVSGREMLEDVHSLFEAQARARGDALEVRVDPAVPDWVLSDRLRLRQVLTNLVSNAVKFTRDGRVDVRADVVDPAGEGRPRLRFVVSDTGIGMGPDVLASVFEPFQQAHRSIAHELGGTGLGLTISLRLVELMGGSISLDSEPGRGTTATVLLPLRPVTARPPVRRPEHADLGGGRRGRVLVVEDNPVNCLLVSRQLDRLGHQAVVMGSGEEVLQRFAEEPVDVVLMDWQLPGIDGLETTRRLREAERISGRPPVPVVAMTASALPGDRARCIEAGMDDFVAKPVSLASLGRIIGRWLPTPATTPDGPGGAPTTVVDPSAPAPAHANAADPGSLPELDPSVLGRIAQELDDVDLLRTFVGTYRRELPGRVAGIEAAASAGDRQELLRLAHVLASTSAAVGAVQLASVSSQLERVAGHPEAVLGSPRTVDLVASLRSRSGAVDAALGLELAALAGGHRGESGTVRPPWIRS